MRYSFATLLVFALLSCFATLQTLYGQIAAANQLGTPRAGVVRYAKGGIYLLYGLPGNYVVGPRMLDEADAASFSEQGGLVARKGTLVLIRSDFSTAGTFNTGESKPLLGIEDDLTTAIAWLPSAQKLVHWNGQAFVSVAAPDLAREGDVSFIAKRDQRTASLLLYSSDGSVSEASVSLETGQVLSVVPVAGAHGPSFRYQSFILFQDKGDLVLTTPASGNTQTIPITADNLEFTEAGSNCFHLRSSVSQRNWMLHFRGGNFEVTEIPPSPAEVKR